VIFALPNRNSKSSKNRGNSLGFELSNLGAARSPLAGKAIAGVVSAIVIFVVVGRFCLSGSGTGNESRWFSSESECDDEGVANKGERECSDDVNVKGNGMSEKGEVGVGRLLCVCKSGCCSMKSSEVSILRF
jgi:hypothetical protein